MHHLLLFSSFFSLLFTSLLLSSLLFVFSRVGAAVTDAAARPFHWLYDTKKLEEITGKQCLQY
jgi:hypothetical protein